MTEQNEMLQDKEQAIAELRNLIQAGIRADGLEKTTVELGVSMFQAEAIIHELLCLVIATQRLLIEKGLVQPEELDKVIAETIEAHANTVDSTIEKLNLEEI